MTVHAQLLPPLTAPLPDHDLTSIGNEVGNDIITATILADHPRTNRPGAAKRAWTVGGNGD
ncbi:hypothetical protein [Nocardia sp. CA-119907]|uniref:hypothetical protein n=1 Tax=Nocardia sp. CA-119907 TaxID=3239973 RepID=UPI003D99E743